MKPKKIAFIINGTKKRAVKLLDDIARIFEGQEIAIFKTQSKGHATELAAKAVESDFRFIVGLGGDGTLNEMLNGIWEGLQNVPNLQSNELFLGILPMGSANDFVRNLRSPRDLKELKNSIDEGRFQTIDVGLAEFSSLEGMPIKRYFINIADIGIGGVIAEKLTRTNRWMGTTLTYQKAIFSTFMTYSCWPISAQMDEQLLESKIMSLVIANSKYFGNGLGIAPFAEVGDGFFDIVILKNISVLDYLKQLSTVKKCLKINHPEVSYAKSKRIMIDSPSKPLPIDMDGEFVGYTPVTFAILPQQINFLS